jgi:hypothetical protein
MGRSKDLSREIYDALVELRMWFPKLGIVPVAPTDLKPLATLLLSID